MADIYNPTNWYWSVQDTSPGTQVWSSASNTYVALIDATYNAWLAAGNSPTIIDTQANLFGVVVNQYNVANWNQNTSLIQNVTLIGGTPVQLTNPVARILEVTPIIGAILELPQANTFGSPPLGQPIIINTVNGSPSWTLKTFGGGTTVLSSVVNTVFVWLIDNSTDQGTWTGFYVTTAGLPTADAQLLMSNASFGSNRHWFAVSPSGDVSITNAGVTTVTGTGGNSLTPASFSPTDQSGAALSFSGVSTQYTRIGNMVFMYGQLTYPVTVDGSNSLISIPVAAAAASYGLVPGYAASTLSMEILAVNNTTTARFINPTSGARYTNTQLSTLTISYMLIYPVA